MKKLPSLALCANNHSMTMSSSLQVPHLTLRTFVIPQQQHQLEGIGGIGAVDKDAIASVATPTKIEMPIIGLGTYKFKKGSGDASKAVLSAVQLGYRHIDTAFIYGGEQTEKEIGKALTQIITSSSSSASSLEMRIDDDIHLNLQRSELFLTSKQWRAYHGYEPTLECLRKSLKRLQTDYLDLYLIHWPGPAYNTMARRKDLMEQSTDGPFVYAKDGHARGQMQALRGETWRAMEDALYQGKCRAIGVSNFTIQHLKALKKTAKVWPPAVNQIELHPYNRNAQMDLIEYCRKEGIVVQAYASLGGQDCGKKTWNVLGGKLLDREEVVKISQKFGKTPAQVLLRWAVQQGVSVIPKSTNIEHMRSNLEAVCKGNEGEMNGWDSGLSDEDMEMLHGLDQSYMKSSTEEDGGDGDIDLNRNKKARLCWVRDPLKMLDFD